MTARTIEISVAEATDLDDGSLDVACSADQSRAGFLVDNVEGVEAAVLLTSGFLSYHLLGVQD